MSSGDDYTVTHHAGYLRSADLYVHVVTRVVWSLTPHV